MCVCVFWGFGGEGGSNRITCVNCSAPRGRITCTQLGWLASRLSVVMRAVDDCTNALLSRTNRSIEAAAWENS